MGTAMPPLRTPRLLIRPFVMEDLPDAHRILDLEAEMEPGTLEERREWLEWTIRNYAALDRLWQPPYGDRAIVRLEDGGPHAGELVGVAGLVPAFGPFAQLPSFAAARANAAGRGSAEPAKPARFTAELGLFWALGNAYRGQGYATEVGRALVDYAFRQMNAARIIATTEYANTASQRVMERLGMRVERNPLPEPVWFQVVGILENPD